MEEDRRNAKGEVSGRGEERGEVKRGKRKRRRIRGKELVWRIRR